MNISVQPYGSSRCYCRPDTTWERESKDFYSPESVNTLHWTPVAYIRISKAGKCISGKFVSRYYDGVGFGTLLYIGGADVASGSCVDHTSILPLPLFNPVVLETEGNKFEVVKNEKPIFSLEAPGVDCLQDGSTLLQAAEAAICKASQLTSLRIGDYVAVELAPASVLAEKTEGSLSFKAAFCENEIFNFKIIF